MKKKFPLIHQLEDCLNQTFENNLKNITFDLALSGGKDSMTLLYLLNDLSGTLGFKLRAIHVHHGLSKSADHWLNLCKETCAKKSIEFISSTVRVEEKHELGIEGRARELRYKELNRLKKGILVTAHHQQDQVETFILQLLRGSGLRGLSSMQMMDYQKSLFRPMLNINPELIDEYINTNNIEHVNDESNADDRFNRNYIRNNLLPKILKRFPGSLKTITRSINLISEGYKLNETIAESDFNFFGDPTNSNRLKIKSAYYLNKSRFYNLVRYWLNFNNIKMLPNNLMEELYSQLLFKSSDDAVGVNLSKTSKIAVYNNFLWIVELKKNQNYEVTWKFQDEILIPEAGRLKFSRQKGFGVIVNELDPLIVRNRRGGEKIKTNHNQPSRSLKYLFNLHKIPPWQRNQFPLLVHNNEVLCAPLIGHNINFQADPKKNGIIMEWVPLDTNN